MNSADRRSGHGAGHAAVRHLSWAAIGRWGQAVIGIGSLAVMTRLLGPENYGLFAVGLLAVSIGEIFTTGALATGLEQRRTLEKGHIDATFVATLAAALLVAAPVAVFADQIANALGSPAAAPLARYATLFLMLSAAASVPTALLRRDLRFRALTQIETAAAVLAAVGGVGAALAGAGPWALAIMETVRRAVIFVLVFACARWRPGLSLRVRHLSDLGVFSIRVLGAQVLGRLDNLAPRLAISVFLGPTALGVYTVAQRVCEQLVGLIGSPFSAIALPTAARANGDREALHGVVDASARIVATLAFPALIGFAAIAPVAVPMLLGEQWGGSVMVVQLLILTGVRTVASGMNIAVMQAVGRAGLPLVSLATALVLHVLLLPWLAPLGLEWTAVAGVLRAYLTWPLSIALMAVATGFSVRRQIRILAPPLIAALGMGGLVFMFQSVGPGAALAPVWRIAAAVALGAGVYTAAILLVDRRARALVARFTALPAGTSRQAG